MKLHTAGPELAGIFRDRILRRGRAWPGASSACFSCIKGSGRDRRRMSLRPLGTELVSRFLQRVGTSNGGHLETRREYPHGTMDICCPAFGVRSFLGLVTRLNAAVASGDVQAVGSLY